MPVNIREGVLLLVSLIVVGVLLVVIECLCLGTVSVCKVFSVSAVLVTECLVVTKVTFICLNISIVVASVSWVAYLIWVKQSF